MGAELARYLFGESGYRLCAGHCQDSGLPQSSMYLPDKRSWAEAPTWWLVLNCLVEPPIHGKDPIFTHIKKFKAWTAANMGRSTPLDTHNAFLKMVRNGGTLGAERVDRSSLIHKMGSDDPLLRYDFPITRMVEDASICDIEDEDFGAAVRQIAEKIGGDHEDGDR